MLTAHLFNKVGRQIIYQKDRVHLGLREVEESVESHFLERC